MRVGEVYDEAVWEVTAVQELVRDIGDDGLAGHAAAG
jgi:hypothetical protein